MADVTVLEKVVDHRWRVVMHFPVPAGNNVVGTPWRTALVRSGIGGSTVLAASTTNDVATAGPGEISDDDKAKIESGELLERVFSLRLGDGNPEAEGIKQYANHKAVETEQLQTSLNQYGRNVDVP